MTAFFTADTHFRHGNIMKITDRYQLFDANVDEHDRYLLDRINETVGETDSLYIVGDFCWRNADDIRAKIKCRNLHLTIGNHDRSGFRKLMFTMSDTHELKIPLSAGNKGTKVFLSHYPHAYWPGSHRGSFHLYGHVHAEREETLDALFPGRRSMDVGVDNAKLLLGEYRPFSEWEVLEMLGDRPGHDHVEFYEAQRQERMSQDLTEE